MPSPGPSIALSHRHQPRRCHCRPWRALRRRRQHRGAVGKLGRARWNLRFRSRIRPGSRKLDLEFEFLGNRTVKNITEAIPVYRLKDESQAERKATAAVDEIDTGRSRQEIAKRRRFYRVLTGCLVLVVFLFALNLVTLPDFWWWHMPAIGLVAVVSLLGIWTFRPFYRLFGDDRDDRETGP